MEVLENQIKELEIEKLKAKEELEILKWEFEFWYSKDRNNEFYVRLFTSETAKLMVGNKSLKLKYWQHNFGSVGRLRIAQAILKNSEEVDVQWNFGSDLIGDYCMLSLKVLGECNAYIREKKFRCLPDYDETLAFVQMYCPSIKHLSIEIYISEGSGQNKDVVRLIKDFNKVRVRWKQLASGNYILSISIQEGYNAYITENGSKREKEFILKYLPSYDETLDLVKRIFPSIKNIEIVDSDSN